MRTVIAKLPIAAVGTVCLALLGTVADVARAQTPPTQPGGTTPGMTTPGTTTPGTTTPGTPSPGTTTPGTGTGTGTTPPGTAPGTGTTGPGQTPSQAAPDPFLTLLAAFFDAVQQFVLDEFPDASPEFQDWLTGALMDYMFGDMVSWYFFGSSSLGGWAGGR